MNKQNSVEIGEAKLESEKNYDLDLYSKLLIGLSYFLVLITFPFNLLKCMKIIKEYERAVIVRIGWILSSGAKGSGLFLILPCKDQIHTIDLCLIPLDKHP